MNIPQARLLLVDDESAFIEILAQRLRRRSFDAACVNSGEEALIRLEGNHDPDVIILDLKMPGMNGIETIQRIKNRWPLIEVILLTGHATVASAVAALKQGAFDYLIKPYELDSLIVKIRSAVRRKRHHEMQIRKVRTKPYISKRECDELIARILDATRRGAPDANGQ
ncbi:MAG: response regulator [Desulfobacterales bacterium]|nr:response regulator [Desulfobacterales bacterium]